MHATFRSPSVNTSRFLRSCSSKLRIWWQTFAFSIVLLLGVQTGFSVTSEDCAAIENTARGEHPNIVLVLADDLGWTDLSCQGSEYYESPHIDALAASGVRFQSFYVCQNCAPTRAALISGQYAPRTGVYTVGSLDRGRGRDRGMKTPKNVTSLPLDKSTIAEMFQSAGYATGMFGKWHLGTEEGYHPAQRGFDEAIVSNGRHFAIRTNPAQEVDPEVYLADFLTDCAVDFIDRHHQEPFFLYVPHFAVHTPIHAKQSWIDVFAEKPVSGGHNNARYAAMIASVDESVGRIVAALEAHEIRDDTLVIFMSDNGGNGGYDSPSSEERQGITDNFPLRGGKGTLYEGGVRVPFIASWPNEIPAGTESEYPAVHVDLFPTFSALAGAEPHEDYPLDGHDFSALFSEPGLEREAPPIYWHFPGYLESYIKDVTWRTTPVSVIRSGNYKLLEFLEHEKIELYDLAGDPSERNNIADSHPEIVEQLLANLHEWRENSGALMPERKPVEQ